MSTDPNETTVDKRPATRFSFGRVLVALSVIAVCGAIAWYAPDMVAEFQARSAYDQLAPLLKDKQLGQTSYVQVHDALGREPTSTSDLTHGRYEENYVFEGISKRFTIRLEYWTFEDDDQWYLFSTGLKAERKLR